LNILCVEDNSSDADLTQRELRQAAPLFHLDVVGTLREARARLQEWETRRYDLVLCDLRLPDADGLSLLAHIRERALPLAVVIITGQGDEETAVAALRAGADDYVAKRADYLAQLPLTLENALQRYRAESARRAKPLRVVYGETDAEDVDLTRRHLARYAPHIHLDVVYSAEEVLQRLDPCEGTLSVSQRKPSRRGPSQEFSRDLLLLDYRLPGMNALELLKELRQVRGLDVPVVLVAGRGDEETAAQAIKLGASDYVVKNVGYLFQLPSVLENAFHRAELARERAALQASEERYRSLFENSDDAILLTAPDGAILAANPAACRMLGRTQAEICQMGRNGLIDSTDPRLPAALEERKQTGKFRGELTFLRGDGARFPGEVSTVVFRDKDGLPRTSMIIRDITARLRAEVALRESEARFATVFQASPIGVIITRIADGQVIDVNPAFLSMFGFTRDEVIGNTSLELKVWACPEERDGLIKRLHEQSRVKNVETKFRVKSGELGDLLVSAETIELAGEQYMLSLMYDITERKRAENGLARSHQLIAALSQVAVRLQTSLVPDRIMEMLGTELKRLGLTCAVIILDSDEDTATLRYTSFESRVVAMAEQLTGVKILGYRLTFSRFPRYAEVVEQQRGVFLSDVLSAAISVLPAIPKPLVEQAARLCGITNTTPTAYLPLLVEDRVLGGLGIWGAGVQETDLPALSVFASQVATAMQNARLFRSINEQREQLRALTARLEEVEETERRRLARELHDRVGQNLTALGINLNIVRSQLPAKAAAKISARLDDSLSLVAETVERTRDVMGELRPPVLDDYGLLAALRWYGDRFAQRTNVATIVRGEELTPRLPPAVETALFRIVQEALTNVSKHARAKKVTLTLEPVDGGARLTIADDGIGLDPARCAAPGAARGWGMLTMRERAQAMGGELRVESAPGEGTRLVVEVGG
jgi:PAS domain S-box-containing protein